jgi:2-keto-4-pentenoate hydratase/2-oxohepta-3-ene-1,7-dioic acid hydratase in catechol pathway
MLRYAKGQTGSRKRRGASVRPGLRGAAVQLTSALVNGSVTAVGIDPERGFVELGRLGRPLPISVLEVIGGTSPEEFSDRLRAEPDASFRPLGDAVFLAPYTSPRKIWGIGLNYTAHADDLAAGYPDEPASFMKGAHTIIGPGDPIDLPEQSNRVTAEAELGLVFGQTCANVEPERALDYLWGVCPVLDQTAEDILQRNPRFLTRAKNFPGFFSFSAITPLHEIIARFGGLADIEVTTAKNGTPHRTNRVANMIFPPELLISFHSKVFPFYPGDLLSTGTPGAVPIEDGDLAQCNIAGVGDVANPVRRAR